VDGILICSSIVVAEAQYNWSDASFNKLLHLLENLRIKENKVFDLIGFAPFLFSH
jgi:hypothetical protein